LHREGTVFKLQVKDCPNCGSNHGPLEVTEEQIALWNSGQGKFVQECFPDLTAEQRELLLTGLNDECWEDYLGSEE
jgi:hypothetical protein